MGQCYSINMYLTYDNDIAVLTAINDFIEDYAAAGKAAFRFVEFGRKSKGQDMTRDDWRRLMKLMFTEKFSVLAMSDFDRYFHITSDFNASYGWHHVMADMFEAVSPMLKDGSYLNIYPDNGKDCYKIKDGKSINVSVSGDD